MARIMGISKRLFLTVAGCVSALVFLSKGHYTLPSAGPYIIPASPAKHAEPEWLDPVMKPVEPMGQTVTTSKLSYARPRDCANSCCSTVAEAEADCTGTLLDCYSCDTSLSVSTTHVAIMSTTTGRVSNETGPMTGYRCMEIPSDGIVLIPPSSTTDGLPVAGCDYFLNLAEFRVTALFILRCSCLGYDFRSYELFAPLTLASCISKAAGPLSSVRDWCQSGGVAKDDDFAPMAESVCTECGGLFSLNNYGYGQCVIH